MSFWATKPVFESKTLNNPILRASCSKSAGDAGVWGPQDPTKRVAGQQLAVPFHDSPVGGVMKCTRIWGLGAPDSGFLGSGGPGNMLFKVKTAVFSLKKPVLCLF